MELFSKVLDVLAKAISLVAGILTVVKVRKELREQRKTAPSSRSSNPNKRRR